MQTKHEHEAYFYISITEKLKLCEMNVHEPYTNSSDLVVCLYFSQHYSELLN